MSTGTELSSALAHVAELGNRQRTRFVCIYGLFGQLGNYSAVPHASLIEIMPYGRFTSHIRDAAALLPHPVFTKTGVVPQWPVGMPEVQPIRVSLLAAPRGDAALVIDGELRGDVDATVVAKALEVTCLLREQMRVDGKFILDWMRDCLDEQDRLTMRNLTLGANVHQCVFPGGQLLERVRNGESFWRVAYRVPAPSEPKTQIGIIRPTDLNYPEVIVVGHGRGVSVIAGFAESVENTFSLVATMLITGLSVLHRSRIALLSAMTSANARPTTSTSEARRIISKLSAQLNELELDLGFGVEAYLDSVLIPEYMTDAYQSSLADALGLRVGLEHSSRTLERLGSVINARRSALEAAVEEQSERGNRIFSGLLAVGSVLAVPPALIVGFEALSQATRRSMLDLSSSWSEYLLAWSPFIILILVGYVLRRRVRSTSPLLEIYEETRTAVVPARLSHSVQVRTKIPAPRPGTD